MMHFYWFNVWQFNVSQAKERWDQRDQYSRAAAMAQAKYVMYAAIEGARL